MDRYKTFLVAAGCPSFYEAANELYISTSAVSKHIQALERELGVVLFTRLPHGIRLTHEGEERLALIDQIVSAYEALVASEDLKNQRELCVFAVPPASRFGMVDIMRDFGIEYSDINVQIVENNFVAKAIIDGEGELGFVDTRFLDSKHLQWITLRTGRIGAILPKGHPLSLREHISLL